MRELLSELAALSPALNVFDVQSAVEREMWCDVCEAMAIKHGGDLSDFAQIELQRKLSALFAPIIEGYAAWKHGKGLFDENSRSVDEIHAAIDSSEGVIGELTSGDGSGLTLPEAMRIDERAQMMPTIRQATQAIEEKMGDLELKINGAFVALISKWSEFGVMRTFTAIRIYEIKSAQEPAA